MVLMFQKQPLNLSILYWRLINQENIIIFHFQTEVFSNASPLEVIQERDNIKREFCKKHNIKLIEIPYSKKGRIKIEDLLI